MEEIKTKSDVNLLSIIKNIFARFWALWGLLTFVITFLIFFLPSMLSHLFKDEKKGQDYFIAVSRWWMNVWLLLVGCPVTVRGKEHFKKGQNYIVVFNHNTLLDVPLSAPYVPGGSKTIAKASFTKVPLFGLFYKKGAILIDRKDERSRIQSYESMRKVLAMGIHMSIYPEGTRNRTKEPLKQFYDGAFKLAIETKKEIIPCIIVGTKKAMPVNKSFYLLPVPLQMHFLDPIPPANNNVKELKEKVFEVMKENYTGYMKQDT